ncbi:MAG: Ig-like domain-containing protein [Nitrosomonas sp.]|nr:Ig-like domain-containing protein [Nitrosomonas sp.]
MAPILWQVTASHSCPSVFFGMNNCASPRSGIQLLFDEPVMAGNGKTTISSDTDTRIIDIHDTNQIIFHEYGDMIISPVENLLPHTLYHIEIANGVITDSAGNPYEDIHAATALQFTTTDPYFITMTGIGSSGIMGSWTKQSIRLENTTAMMDRFCRFGRFIFWRIA